LVFHPKERAKRSPLPPYSEGGDCFAQVRGNHSGKAEKMRPLRPFLIIASVAKQSPHSRKNEIASPGEQTRLAMTFPQSLRGPKARSNLAIETASETNIRPRSDRLGDHCEVFSFVTARTSFLSLRGAKRRSSLTRLLRQTKKARLAMTPSSVIPSREAARNL